MSGRNLKVGVFDINPHAARAHRIADEGSMTDIFPLNFSPGYEDVVDRHGQVPLQQRQFVLIKLSHTQTTERSANPPGGRRSSLLRPWSTPMS